MVPTDSADWPELDPSLKSSLQDGVRQLGLDLQAGQAETLLDYIELLTRWNQAYNLTAVREPGQMVVRHLLDSLAIAPFLQGRRLIDVGTGAGLPGVPLAVLYPEREFHLLDSNGKKTRFLFQVKTALGLDNMTVHHARVESFRDERAFDTVLSRAFASLEDMVEGCRHLAGDQGMFLAMKGTLPRQELAAVETSCEVAAVHTLSVPGLDEQRHLVELRLRRQTDHKS